MPHQFGTVSTKGQLVIPAEMRAELGITPGSKLALTVEDNRIVLQPVSDLLVDEMLGMTGGGWSMADELQQQRRNEK